MVSLGSKMFSSLLALLHTIYLLPSFINASAHSDLNKLQNMLRSLDYCRSTVSAFQELLIRTTIVETTISLKTDISTLPSISDMNLPTNSTLFEKNVTVDTSSTISLATDAFEDLFSTTENPFSIDSSTLQTTDLSAITTSDVEEFSSTTEWPENGNETILTDGRKLPTKKNNKEFRNDIDKLLESDEDDKWGMLVMDIIQGMLNILQNIYKDPYQSEYTNDLDLKTWQLEKAIKNGKEDKELVLESNWESLQNASKEVLSNLFASRKIVKTEIERAASTKMGTTAVICLVSILLAFVVFALLCVLLKPWKRCRKKTEDIAESSRSSSSTTFSQYYRKTSALEGIRNFSYVDSNEPVSTSTLPAAHVMSAYTLPTAPVMLTSTMTAAPVMSASTLPAAPVMSASTLPISMMSIPSISIPRPTIIRMSDRYQPSSATRRNCTSQDLELEQLPRSYISYT